MKNSWENTFTEKWQHLAASKPVDQTATVSCIFPESAQWVSLVDTKDDVPTFNIQNIVSYLTIGQGFWVYGIEGLLIWVYSVLETFSIRFTANGKWLLAVWSFLFAVVTKIDLSMALTSFGGKSLLIFFKVFWDKAINPFSTSSPWEHNGFFVFRKNSGKYPRNFLIITRTFWLSLGHLGRQHHVLASVWPSKRHFLEIQEGIDWYRTP